MNRMRARERSVRAVLCLRLHSPTAHANLKIYRLTIINHFLIVCILVFGSLITRVHFVSPFGQCCGI